MHKNLMMDSLFVGDYGTANVGGSSNPCMCGGASGSSQSRWQGGTTWKGNGVRPNHLDISLQSYSFSFYYSYYGCDKCLLYVF